jgi:hypothetical protein
MEEGRDEPERRKERKRTVGVTEQRAYREGQRNYPKFGIHPDQPQLVHLFLRITFLRN